MQPDLQSTTTTGQHQLQAMIRHLLDEAKDALGERRAERREPFFSPITLALPGEGQPQFTCFSRDISPAGIGLLHCVAVELGEVVLTIPSTSGRPLRIRGQVMWCQSCGEGWYMSGVRFLDVVSSCEECDPAE
jgi:hypothetical protein